MLIVTSGVVAMAMYDRLIRWLYINRNEEWKVLGKPTGSFSWFEGTTIWRSSVRRTELAQQWLFAAPKWITENQKLRTALWIYRGATLCAVSGMIAFWFLLLK